MAGADYPLLIFPQAARADRARSTGRGGVPKVPGPADQAERIAPQFQRLADAMEQRRIALQGNPLGLLPEQVLVLETVGSIEDFINAVRKIAGLEWLAEHEIDGIAPAHGFEDTKRSDKDLRGQVFLVMTDQQALSQLQRQFEGWTVDPTAPFARGLALLKRVFEQLHTIRPWGSEDRIRETGLLADWQDRLEHDEAEVPFEAELWFRESTEGRNRAEAELRRVISSSGGELVGQCVIPEIAYHAVLGRLPQADVGQIVKDHESFRTIRLLRCEEIMHVRPVGQCAVLVTPDTLAEPLTDDELSRLVADKSLPQGAPIVALFDGMPLAGHRLLEHRLVVDDPDGYEAAYQARERQHGTGMASLICHGDLNQSDGAAATPLYVRPVMQPRRGYDGQFREEIPENVLPGRRARSGRSGPRALRRSPPGPGRQAYNSQPRPSRKRIPRPWPSRPVNSPPRMKPSSTQTHSKLPADACRMSGAWSKASCPRG